MMTEASILVVDDDPGIRDVVGLALTERGHKVVTAADGVAALSLLERVEFDLVIADVRITGANGTSFLKATRRVAPETDLMVLTAFSEIDSAVECARVDAMDIVYKPLDLVSFSTAVDGALERRRLRTRTLLYQGCQEILASDGESPLYERICRTAMELLDADDASMMLLDERGSLRIVYATGIPEMVQGETRLALGERVAGQVALDRSPALLPQALVDDPRFEGLQSYGRVRSALIYPLLAQDDLLGVLNLNRVESDRPFRKADLETAGIVASHAAMALRNHVLMRRLVVSERLAAVGQLAAGIVHEINNALTYIGGNAICAQDILRALPANGEGCRSISSAQLDELELSLADVVQGSRRLRQIVTDMRSLSRKDERMDARFDVTEAVRTALRIAEPTIRAAGQLRAELGESLVVTGNPGLLSQVLLNLLGNAADALQSADRSNGEIVVRSWKSDAGVVIEVEDNGPGIPLSSLPRVMEPFYTTKEKENGSGLGLSISREIVERHGGEIMVRSKLGEGATFTVVLPDGDRNVGRKDAVDAAPRGTAPARVLVVEDDHAVRAVLQRTLRRHFDVRLARDGAEAIEMLRRDHAFDAVVSDIVMPRVSGLELLHRMSNAWPRLAFRTALITGATMERGDLESLARRGVPVLRKPVDCDQLVAVVASLATGDSAGPQYSAKESS